MKLNTYHARRRLATGVGFFGLKSRLEVIAALCRLGVFRVDLFLGNMAEMRIFGERGNIRDEHQVGFTAGISAPVRGYG